ncbi:MAG: hypothetical protein CMP22_07890 [Rickettsiales bacterium]|nr:hypothetical protein [Rickettsiales bacterium]
MKRIDTPTATDIEPGKKGFTDGEPSTGTPATTVDSSWLNQLQEEIAYVIEENGITLDEEESTQLHQAISLMSAFKISALTSITSLQDTDKVPVMDDSEATDSNRSITFLNFATAVLSKFSLFGFSSETTIADNDFLVFSDTSNSNNNKKLTFSHFATAILNKLSLNSFTTETSLNDADFVVFADDSNSLENRKVSLLNFKNWINSGVTTPDATTTTKGKVELATDAEVKNETASKVLTADQIKYNKGIAKAWINFDGTGSITVNEQHNVSSITDLGTGKYQINLSISMVGSYVVMVRDGADKVTSKVMTPKAASSFEIRTSGGSSGYQTNSDTAYLKDGEDIDVLVFGNIT